MTLKFDRKKESKKFEATRPLLVEGSNDLNVIAEIANDYQLPASFCIQTCGGVSEVLKALDVQLKNDKYERLGIVVDADSNINDRWIEIKKVFQNYPLDLPESPDPNGTIISNETKKIGVWLMPDNQRKGNLEDLFLKFILAEDKLVPFVNQSLATIEAEGVARYKEQDRIKAFVRTWLAWQDDSGILMGRAISNKTNKITDTTPAADFSSWLKRLFI
jgi:hypothetical protein